MVSKVHISGTKDDLKKIFGIVKSISREAIFHFEKDCAIIKCHDESRTAFLEVRVMKDYFQDFRIERPIEIGFDVLRTFTVIEMCDGQISMSINNGISIVSKNKFDIDARIPQIYIKTEDILAPEYSYTTSAILRVKYLANNLSHTLQFSNFVEIAAKEKLILKVSAPYGEYVAISIPVESESILNQKDGVIIVGAEVINKMLSNFEKQKTVKLNIDESLPAIELIYEESNLRIRALFSRYIDEE